MATSGYDGLIIRGRASTPVYLALVDGKPELHDAGCLWGQDTGETEARLRDEYPGAKICSIGQAGENGVVAACIVNDYNRVTGRPGFGAVMGSKNLKAVVVRGSTQKAIADRIALRKGIQAFTKALMEARGGLKEFGTAATLWALNRDGILPTANFQRGTFEQVEAISPDALQQILVGRDNCTACPVHCKRVVKTRFGDEAVIERYGGPEYETIAAFGSNCLNGDLASIALANQRCNMYGLDTISAGNIIAFLMECVEKRGLGLDLRWGDGKAILNMIDRIAFRRDIGDVAAHGLDHLARALHAEDLAVSIKGQEVPMHDPRGKTAFALDYATTPRGGQHNEGIHDAPQLQSEPIAAELGVTEPMDRFEWEGKPRVAKIFGDLRSFTNSLIMCEFTNITSGNSYNMHLVRALLESVIGAAVTAESMLTIGERNYVLLKIHSARCGYTRADDGLPPRLKVPLPEGASAGRPIVEEVLQAKVDEYYELRGFDKWGPTDKKLTELGLGELSGMITR